MSLSPEQNALCAYCKEEIFPVDPKDGYEGVAECRNPTCPKTLELALTRPKHKTLRCPFDGTADFVFHYGGLASSVLFCDHCPNDIKLAHRAARAIPSKDPLDA